jgi:hypothetical protein
MGDTSGDPRTRSAAARVAQWAKKWFTVGKKKDGMLKTRPGLATAFETPGRDRLNSTTRNVRYI